MQPGAQANLVLKSLRLFVFDGQTLNLRPAMIAPPTKPRKVRMSVCVVGTRVNVRMSARLSMGDRINVCVCVW